MDKSLGYKKKSSRRRAAELINILYFLYIIDVALFMVVDDAYSTIYMYIYGIYHLVYYVREYRNSDRSIPYFIPVSEKRQYTGIPQCNVDVGCLLIVYNIVYIV